MIGIKEKEIKNNIQKEIESCFEISANVAWNFYVDELQFTKEQIEYLKKYHMKLEENND